jgi:hypothetical protein
VAIQLTDKLLEALGVCTVASIERRSPSTQRRT